MDFKGGVMEIKKRIKEILKEKKLVFIGIAGGSASGKTWVAEHLSGQILSMDSYYIGINNMRDNNFDHPSALDLHLLKKNLQDLKDRKTIEKPIYDFKTHSRIGYELFKLKNKVLIVEGLFSLNEILKDELDLKVFIDVPEKIRLERRINRDVNERGRTKESVLQQWIQVEEMYKKFILPTKENADVVINNH